VFFVLFVFALYLLHPMLPVSLDWPFLIASSVFSNVYLIVKMAIICKFIISRNIQKLKMSNKHIVKP
jgi:hypothetical protein